ncbi:hypothetical protein AA313_de0200918 [Arthrobotrys entomopaga]|nr:hypothetical protein AA313_de0200918 [Arthrobotrys entomopaga]
MDGWMDVNVCSYSLDFSNGQRPLKAKGQVLSLIVETERLFFPALMRSIVALILHPEGEKKKKKKKKVCGENTIRVTSFITKYTSTQVSLIDDLALFKAPKP